MTSPIVDENYKLLFPGIRNATNNETLGFDGGNRTPSPLQYSNNIRDIQIMFNKYNLQ